MACWPAKRSQICEMHALAFSTPQRPNTSPACFNSSGISVAVETGLGKFGPPERPSHSAFPGTRPHLCLPLPPSLRTATHTPARPRPTPGRPIAGQIRRQRPPSCEGDNGSGPAGQQFEIRVDRRHRILMRPSPLTDHTVLRAHKDLEMHMRHPPGIPPRKNGHEFALPIGVGHLVSAAIRQPLGPHRRVA